MNNNKESISKEMGGMENENTHQTSQPQNGGGFQMRSQFAKKIFLLKNWLGIRTVDGLSVNTNPLSRGGVLGRKDYFVYLLTSLWLLTMGFGMSRIAICCAGLGLFYFFYKKDYAIVLTKIFFVCLPFQTLSWALTASGLLSPSETIPILLRAPVILYTVALLGAYSYINCINSFKRLRDIRGTMEDQLVWQACLTLLPTALIIFGVAFIPDPYGGIPAGIFLFFSSLFMIVKQGVITSPQTAIPLNRLFSGPRETASSKTSTLKELYELQKSGDLTQEEFDEEKKKILGKAA